MRRGGFYELGTVGARCGSEVRAGRRAADRVWLRFCVGNRVELLNGEDDDHSLGRLRLFKGGGDRETDGERAMAPTE